MSDQVFLVLGGIGLFLFGMKVMTDGLREAAGGRLRRLLAQFTNTPLQGVVTGAAATAIVQSSSAVTVMVVGFVGAGLLSFPHALGVLYGANIGTTFTGWMITLLGFKMNLGTIALPGVFVSSLLALVGQGTWARVARIVAGLCLLFIGLDMMQAGAASFGEALQPASLPSGGLWGRLQLLLTGLLMTVVMQSSSAALAIALVFLGTGAVSFEQAAAMVIGMNLGTTVTAMMATIGGSAAMRETAVANLLFNVVTALIAFPLLSATGGLFLRVADAAGEQTALALFHTAFNFLGTIIFLPITPAFARAVQRLIPTDELGLTAGLDAALLKDEGAAMDAVHSSISRSTCVAFDALGRALAPASDTRALSALATQLPPALEEIGDYIALIRVPEGKAVESDRLGAMLHQMDHLTRLTKRLDNKAMIPVVLSDEELCRPSIYFGIVLRRASEDGRPAAAAARLDRLSGLVAGRAKRHRRATLLREHIGLITVNELFDRTDAMRWLERVVGHSERIAHYDQLAGHSAR